MHRYSFYSLLPILLLSACTTQFNQQQTQWSYTQSGVKQLSANLQKIKTVDQNTPPFPLLIPRDDMPLYATTEIRSTPENTFWQINAGTTQNCVMKTCIRGYLSSQTQTPLTLRYNIVENGVSRTEKKESLSLVQGIRAYYTPGHAEGDWHFPTIEWIQNNQHYTLAWDVENNAKSTLQAMANSGLIRH